MNDRIGIYVHIPFCKTKCHYCDFLSFVPSPGDAEAYADALINEINNADLGGYTIDTIFIGGGTPTCVPPFLLRRILEALKRFDTAPGAEFTAEANPGTLDPGILDVLLQSGVNRLSVGLQSADDRLLRNAGRGHTAAEFYESFGNARAAGFGNINIDIMFSLPGQTLETFRDTCAAVAELGPEHISSYSLTVEDGTPLKKMIEDKKISLPDDAADRDMYHHLTKYFTGRGYTHYEISNFAKSGFECRHNISCWERGEYTGFGLGAHSFLNKTRFNNTKDFRFYINNSCDKKLIIENEIYIDEAEELEETMFLGLRSLRGVVLSDRIAAFYKNQIDKLVASRLVKINGGRLSLTDRGLDFANAVFSEFIGVIR